MSDDYIAQLISDELAATCPGGRADRTPVEAAVARGDVQNVCDDPGCDTHPREEDQLRKVIEVRRELGEMARDVKRWEERLLSQVSMPTAGITPEVCRQNIRRIFDWTKSLEAEMDETEEKLRAVVRAGGKLVPRKKKAAESPGQLKLFR